MPTRILSWHQMVLEADPSWQRTSLNPVTYEFSNGRRFVDPNPLYGVTTSTATSTSTSTSSATPPSTDASVSLTGLSASTSLGSLTPVRGSGVAISGVSGSSAVGTVKAQGIFEVALGVITDPYGQAYTAKGINVFDNDMSNVTLSLINSLFPGCNFIRLACGGDTNGFRSAQSNSSIISWVNSITNNGLGPIVVEIENHDPGTGGVQAPPYTGSLLTSESSWYSTLATALKSNPYVWFGTMNEPGTDTNASAQHTATYNAVRGAGCHSPLLMCLVGGNPDGFPDNASAYTSMVNVIWDQHWYNWMTSGSTNQTTVNSLLLGYGNDESGWTTSANPGGTIPVMVAEGGFLDYNGPDPTVEVHGGDGTDQIVTAMFQTAQTVPFVGAAVWIWASLYTSGNSATDLVNQSNNTYTEHGTYIHSNGYM